jgi:hypothetical protein
VGGFGRLRRVLAGFLTFYMKGMVPLRVIALCSNVAFLIYAGTLDLVPIFLLHAALIPINLRRLVCARREQHVGLKSSAPGA